MWRLVLVLAVGCSAALLPRAARAQQAAADADTLAPLGRAIDANPTSPDAYDAFAQAAFKARRWDDAIARLKIGVARIPSYHAGWYKLGYAYRQKRAFSDAATAYRKFTELEPTKADPYFGLAAALQGSGDNAGAATAYRKYIELEKAPEKQKFVEQAKAEIARLGPATPPPVAVVPPPPSVVKTTPPPVAAMPPPPLVASTQPAANDRLLPPSSDALSLRAQADKLRRAGRLDEAAVAYENALKADPGNLDLHVELGDVYFSQNRYADAVRVFRAATDRDPAYALGWYNLAHAQARAGDQGNAVKAYRAYIKLRPSDPDPYYGLGQACKALGDKSGAIDAFRTYLQMEHRPELQRWIDRARQEIKILSGQAKADTSDLKNPFEDDRPGFVAAADDMLPPGDPAMATRARIDRELAADDLLPVDLDNGLDAGMETSSDHLVDVKFDDKMPNAGQRDRLARYASALAAYRLALERQADEVASLYQRGADRVLVEDLKGARKVWASTTVASHTVEDARARLEKARQALVK